MSSARLAVFIVPRSGYDEVAGMRGARSRHKVLEIDGITAADLDRLRRG